MTPWEPLCLVDGRPLTYRGIGRRPLYCSVACRRRAEAAEARLAMLRSWGIRDRQVRELVRIVAARRNAGAKAGR